ncbi:AraC family transcriptional regulator [Dethiothermospora halolimnae]|uniref:AraC family transcriptional regulator n=1 Tax=Dethiothermospora halolimnae TaxID=3114390 RepID=UPI003CCBD96B
MNEEKNISLYEEYISRINKVQDYIENNISEEFSLFNLSRIANFSSYHFHRIFRTMTGETLFQYIQRVRLEKAGFLLLANKNISITQIALECGFSNQSSFAKAFKNYFNMSASKLRTENYPQKNINSKEESNMGKVFSEIVCYNNVMRKRQYYERQKHINIPYTVEVADISEMKVAYIRHTGPYKKDAMLFQKLFRKLYSWGDKRKLIDPRKTQWITIYHDTPDITDDDKLRISVCMTISEDVEGDGEVGILKVQGGKYAIGHFKLNEDQYEDAWNAMYTKWLPKKGYQPDDRLAFELYLNDTENTLDKHIVDIYIPIKPL